MKRKSRHPQADSAVLPWYRRTGIISLLLVVFFPVGAYCMWKFTNWRKNLKTFVTIVSAVWFLFWVMVWTAVVTSVPIESLSLPQQSITIEAGESVDLPVSVSPDDAVGTIQYISSDEEIATFEDETVTGISDGTVQVYATDNTGKIASNKVTVTVKGEPKKEADSPESSKPESSEPESEPESSEPESSAPESSEPESKPAVSESQQTSQAPATSQAETSSQPAQQAESTPPATPPAETAQAETPPATPPAEAATPPATTPPAQQQPQGQMVWVTPTGKRYHYDGSCNGGSYYQVTLTEAQARGLTPCKKCAGG